MAKGTVAAGTVKLGDNVDTSKNFLIKVPTVADGTLVIERGDGTDVLSIDAAGKTTFPVMPAVGTAAIVSSTFGGAGNLIKYADGTFIFTTQVTIANPVINTYVVADKSLGFTAVGAVIVTASVTSTNAAPTAGFVYAAQLNSTTLRITASANAISTNIYNVIAVGRWK